MSLVVKYSESPVVLQGNQKLVEIQFPNTATEIIGLKTDNLTKIDVTKCSKDFVSTVKSNYQDKFNNKGENIEVVEPIPNNEIWYTASAELNLSSSYFGSGATMLSHTFKDGKGVITCNGDITYIDIRTFQKCSGLTSITIPNSVTSIGDYAFYNCSGLTSVTIPNSVTSIDTAAFQGCSGLTSIVIPDSVTSIGSYAFGSCIGLTSINIPDSVISINNNAFSSCSGLTSITIPNSVTQIGASAFSSCSGLTSIVVSSGNTVYDSRNNCNAIIETSTNTLIAGCKNTIIPDSVTSIGNYAFYGCSELTSLNIPDSVTSIGNYAFQNCLGLTSITIPNSVTQIGYTAFKGCSGLTSIEIPYGVTSIYNDSFQNLNNLSKITINGKCRIPSNAFQQKYSGDKTTALKTITFNDVPTFDGYGIFWGCTKCDTIYYNCSQPPVYTSKVTSTYNALTSTTASNALGYETTSLGNNIIHVPQGSGLTLADFDKNVSVLVTNGWRVVEDL